MRSTGVREQTISFSRENWQMEKMYVQVSARLPWNSLCCLSLRCYFSRVLVMCWWQISTQSWRLCLCQFFLLFCLLPTLAKLPKKKSMSSGMLFRKPFPYICLNNRLGLKDFWRRNENMLRLDILLYKSFTFHLPTAQKCGCLVSSCRYSSLWRPFPAALIFPFGVNLPSPGSNSPPIGWPPWFYK